MDQLHRELMKSTEGQQEISKMLGRLTEMVDEMQTDKEETKQSHQQYVQGSAQTTCLWIDFRILEAVAWLMKNEKENIENRKKEEACQQERRVHPVKGISEHRSLPRPEYEEPVLTDQYGRVVRPLSILFGACTLDVVCLFWAVCSTAGVWIAAGNVWSRVDACISVKLNWFLL